MNRIYISGYKSIKNLKLQLRPINLLIGANGSGKSNFLSFFEFLRMIYNQTLREYVALTGIHTLLHKGEKTTEEISGHLFFQNTNAYSFTIKKGGEGFVFVKEDLWYENPFYNNPFSIASVGPESSLKTVSIPRAEYIRKYLEQFAKYHFHDTGKQTPFNKESNIENDKYFLYETGSNLGAFLYNIKEVNSVFYYLIVKTIQSIAPYFNDFFFRPENNGNVKLRWQSKHSSTVYGVNDLSDGTLRFIALATLFLQPNPPETIIIDEPELGLHPSAIAKLAGMIKSVSEKNSQVIIATQSTDLISHFEPEDIIAVDQREGESVFERLDSEKLKIWLDDYAIDDLWKRNIITSGQINY